MPVRCTSIRIVICYFGEWPKWFAFFLKSCAFNPTVEFLLFTDCPVPGAAPPNVQFIPFSLGAFNALASGKLGLRVNVENPYKLCDYRPAYGVIFEEYLAGADFWGCGDLDVVFGNIRKFMTARVLARYDVITAKKEYLLGHFTLYRNAGTVNRLYEQSEDYRKVFESQKHYCFDECNFLWWHILAGRPVLSVKYEIDSMSHVVMRLGRQRRIKAFFKSLVVEQDQLAQSGELAGWNKHLRWQEGRLTNADDRQEYMYLHFHFLKRAAGFHIPEWRTVPDQFYISSAGFHA